MMVPCQFMIRLDQAPVDEQVRRLFARATDLCVEVGAWRSWAAVAVEREARSLADAFVASVGDLESVGLVPLDAGPDCDLAPIWLIAERAGCSPRAVRRWISGESGPGGFPPAVEVPGRPAYYRWGDVALWLRRRLGLRLPEHDATFAAANLVLRLRGVAPRVERASAFWALLPSGRPS